MNEQDLEPSQVVVDIVVAYSPVMPMAGQAAVLHDHLMICTRNHRGQALSFAFPIHFDGETSNGDGTAPPRFILYKIAPTVWKLAPSINDDLLHAFVTIVGVPEDVTWGKAP